MQRLLRSCSAALFLLLPLLIGCGTTPAGTTTTTTPTPPVQTPSVTALPIDGRWSFQGGSNYFLVTSGNISRASGSGVQFHGAISTNGSIVTAAGVVSSGVDPLSSGSTLNVTCLGFRPVTLHGTFSTSRHLSLSSDPGSIDVLTLDADVPADPHGAATATASLTGPCPASGSLIGQLYEPLAGTYQGALQSSSAASQISTNQGTATAILAETSPDSTGRSVVSGTLTLALPNCTAQVPILELRYGGALYSLAQQPPFPQGSSGVTSTYVAVPFIDVTGNSDGKQARASSFNLGLDCQPDPSVSVHTLLSAQMSR